MASQALTLTTNLSSMAANRSVQGAQAQVAKSVEKLSSGIQIRQARDNPSGLAISSVFQKQIQTGTMAHRNVNDAISLVQTADSALREATDMLTRIKSLAVQGANDSLSKDQYFSLAQEMRELMHELANSADRTTFNGNAILGRSPKATRDVYVTKTETSKTGFPLGTWVALNSNGALDGLAGRVRVEVSAAAGNLKLNTPQSTISVTTPLGTSAYDGSAESISLEGDIDDVKAALGQLLGKRNGPGAADISFNVFDFAATSSGDGIVTSARTGSTTSGSSQNVFIGGEYIELGLSQKGGFGSVGAAIPSGFYGRLSGNGIGMLSDIDGFARGVDKRIDYFLPGSPEERWSVSFNDGSERYGGFAGLENDKTSAGVSLTSNNVSILSTAGSETLEAGFVGEVAASGSSKLKVEVVHRLNEEDKYFESQVTLTNVSGAGLSNVKFMRSFDPDNTVDIGGPYPTTNTIESQASESGRSLVSATSGFSSYQTAYGEKDYIGYLSDDSRSHVYTGGFANENPNAAVASADPVGTSVSADQAIGIVFSLGSLAAGESQEFSYKTILSASAAASLTQGVLRKSTSLQLAAEQILTREKQVLTKEPLHPEFQRWEFVSGTGESDSVELAGIPIWESAESNFSRNSSPAAMEPSLMTGALSALYQRILWLANRDASPIETGKGFEIFAQTADWDPTAPDQQVFDNRGGLVSSKSKTLNELIDASLLQLNAHRSYFGSYATRLTYNLENLTIQNEGLSAARSKILDTDYAGETAKLTRIQILRQASTAMLAQANAMPNAILALIS